MPRSPFLIALFLVACAGKTSGVGMGSDAGLDARGDVQQVGDDQADAYGPPLDAQPGDAPGDAPLDVLGPGCGLPEQPCCPGDACGAGGCCVDQICVGAGQSCGHSLGACSGGSCGSCGALGQPCCPEYLSNDCSAVPDAGACAGCTQVGTMCSNETGGGTCIACGAPGQECCTYACLGQYSTCLSFTDDAGKYESSCSLECGGAGQPCCQNDACKDDGCCLAGPAGPVCAVSPTCGCTAGQCTTCGVQGLACCQGGTCQVDQGQCSGVDGGTCAQMHP